jgi:hypothetical protein
MPVDRVSGRQTGSSLLPWNEVPIFCLGSGFHYVMLMCRSDRFATYFWPMLGVPEEPVTKNRGFLPELEKDRIGIQRLG